LRRWHGPTVLTEPQFTASPEAFTRIVLTAAPSAEPNERLTDDVRAWATRLGAYVELLTVTPAAAAAPFDLELHQAQLDRLIEVARELGVRPVHLTGRSRHSLSSAAHRRRCSGTPQSRSWSGIRDPSGKRTRGRKDLWSLCGRAVGSDNRRMTSPQRIRVFLLDDHEVVRRGVRELLESEGDIVVVGEGSTAADALARVPAVRPDVAVLDVRLPDGNGVTVCRELRSALPDLVCLMLTSFADDEALFDAIMAGAAGYVLKQVRGADILGAVRTVAAGGSLLDPRTTAQMMDRLRKQADEQDPLAGLTEQERRILELIGEGLTNRQIGERMFLAEKTVKNYVSSVLAKLGMERRTQAAAFVARLH